MRVKIRTSSKRGRCLVCNADLGFLRKLAKRRFCCDEHEQKYLTDLGDIAVMRLHSAGLRIDATRSSGVHV